MANMFNEDGTYNKTNWKAGDKITANKLNKIEESLEAINNNDISRHLEADTRLDALEEQAAGQNEVTNERIEELNDLVLDNKDELDLEIYDINSRMTFLEEELNEGIEEVHNVAETVDGKIATAEANMTAQVNQGKADMEAMVAEVEADLEGLHAKDEELSEQLAHNANKINNLDFVNLKDYVLEDEVDFTNAFNRAFNDSGNIFIPQGVYDVGEVMLPDKDIYIFSNNAKLNCISNTFVFKRRSRGYLTNLENITFTGNGVSFYYDSSDESLPNHIQQYEYLISNCKFLSNEKEAIILYGAREGTINNCYFEENLGIQTEFSINSVISNCHFKNCSYSILSKLGSEGLICSNLVMLACSYGIYCARTTGVQINSSMIDYCDSPILLKGATDVIITNNYISTRTSSPAIHTLAYDDGFEGYNYNISGNNLRTNASTGEIVVVLKNIYCGNFNNNHILNYVSNGIEYSNLTNFKINYNFIRSRAGYSGNSIISLADGDDATVAIEGNNVVDKINRVYVTSIFNNTGFITRKSGEAIIQSGDTSVTVTHGLSITPSKDKITLTPTTPTLGQIAYYVSSVNETTFTITLNGSVSSLTGIAWTYNN